MVLLEGLGKMKKIQWSRLDSNPRFSGLRHSASTTYATACRYDFNEVKSSLMLFQAVYQHLLCVHQFSWMQKNIPKYVHKYNG
jgi:hypothetical protein